MLLTNPNHHRHRHPNHHHHRHPNHLMLNLGQKNVKVIRQTARESNNHRHPNHLMLNLGQKNSVTVIRQTARESNNIVCIMLLKKRLLVWNRWTVASRLAKNCLKI
jgi:hypothetical protein